MRNEFPRAVKVAAWQRAKGRCEAVIMGNSDLMTCDKKLFPGDIFYDHRIADGLGGKPVLENCQVLCKAHHDAKTFTCDVPKIAKTKRNYANHIGAKKPSRGFGDSKLKRKIDGSVVNRTTGEMIGRRG